MRTVFGAIMFATTLELGSRFLLQSSGMMNNVQSVGSDCKENLPYILPRPCGLCAFILVISIIGYMQKRPLSADEPGFKIHLD
jgi:hypothetical protein